MAPVRRLAEKFIGLLTVTDTTLAEFQSSTTFVLFGAVFLDPFPTLTQSKFYTEMGHIAPEWLWGVLCLTLGIIQAVANVRPVRDLRRWCAFIASVVFGFLGVLMTSTVPSSTAAPVYGTFSLVQGIVYLRLALRGKRAGRVRT